MKITHTTLLYTDLSMLDEIPSEYLEQYLSTYMSYIIESVGTGWKKPHEAKSELKGLMNFVSLFGGLHSRIAMNNEYFKIAGMSDNKFFEICKEVCKN